MMAWGLRRAASANSSVAILAPIRPQKTQNSAMIFLTFLRRFCYYNKHLIHQKLTIDGSPAIPLLRAER